MDLDLFDEAVAARRRDGRTGLTWEIVRHDPVDEPASSLRAETPSRAAELMLWVSGEADLTWAELEPRVTDPVVEHYEVTTAFGLAGLLDDFERHIGIAL